jgi:hypothetical protein
MRDAGLGVADFRLRVGTVYQLAPGRRALLVAAGLGLVLGLCIRDSLAVSAHV